MIEIKFSWWWETPEELAVWRKLNSLSQDEKATSKYERICADMIQRFGNIYFYSPYPAQLPVHEDTNQYIYIHGNNSSGKSYCAAAETAYRVIGWSPYKQIYPAKYGTKIVWAFSPTFDNQRSSSQVHLFSTNSVNDIGLLPKLDYIPTIGGEVWWGKKGALDKVILPDKTILEFKSAEMSTLATSAAGVDFIWLDECPPLSIHDEAVARIIRKDGSLIMSFLLEEALQHYVVKDLHRQHLQDISNGIPSKRSFYFLSIEDNLSLDNTKDKKTAGTEEQRRWRFSEGGKFITEPHGMRVWSDFSEEIHVKDDLLVQYDTMRTLWRAWDLGRLRAVCIGGQVDRFGRIKILFSLMGENRQLTDFIDDVELFCTEKMPNILAKLEILPHDANRKSPLTSIPISSVDIFHHKKPRLLTEVVYVKAEPTIDMGNHKFKELREKQPLIQIDGLYAPGLVQACRDHVRDKHGKPQEDEMYEHYTDALKLFLARLLPMIYASTISHSANTPSYFRPLEDNKIIATR